MSLSARGLTPYPNDLDFAPHIQNRGHERICDLVLKSLPTLKSLARWIFLATILLVLYFGSNHASESIPFAIMAISSVAVCYFCLSRNMGGLPVLAGLALQHGITYCVPLLRRNVTVTAYDSSLLLPCSFQFLLFMIALLWGRSIACSKTIPKPSKYLLLLSENRGAFERRLAKIGIGLLAFGLSLQLLFFTGLYWSLAGGIGARTFSIASAISLVCAVSGGFLGGYVSRTARQFRGMFWLTWCALFAVLVSGMLLSSATGLIGATCAGLMLGSKRIPWLAVVLMLSVLSLLNQGKFVMRERYWGPDAEKPATITTLPEFFASWINASLDSLMSSDKTTNKTGHDGQAFADRINNLQNLLFVNRAISIHNIPTLRGRGYALLPSVFVPRIIWPGKPRTHEGQVLLNLHFGRQANEEATLTTYIAWGFLPEAIGNFGLWLGPILGGLLIGGVCGWVETWSRLKELTSIEGLCACITMIYTLTSFEMTLGVFAAAVFQTLVVLVLGGLFVRQLSR